jgi:excisionase family DNA binding protein
MLRQMDTSMLHEPISMPASEEEQIGELYKLLKLGVPALVGLDGERLDLPESVYRLLKGVVKNMQQGRTIMLVPEQAYLTTQKVANILGVSRPHVVKLLDSGAIPFHKTGSHRRVLLKDVVAYAKDRDAKRKKALDEIAREAFEDGLYDSAQMPPGGEDE